MFEIASALRDILAFLGILMAAGLGIMLLRHLERSQLPREAEAAARAEGYVVVSFPKVVRIGRHSAVACGSADGHKAIYFGQGTLRVADRDALAASKYRRLCTKGPPPHTLDYFRVH